MTKKGLINRTIKTLEKLPEDRIHEIADFADFMLKKHEEQVLQKGMAKLISEYGSFAFLQEEELYHESDLKEKF